MMRRLLIAALLLGLASSPALAQNGYVQYGLVGASSPSLANGAFQPLSLDLNGNLRTVIAGGITVGSVSQGTPGSSAWLTSDAANGPAQPGTPAARSMLVGGVFNSSPPSLTNGQQEQAQLDSGGALLVNVIRGGGTGGTSSGFTAAFPGTGTAVGMSQGGNMVAMTGTSGSLNVNCTAGCNASSDTSNGAVTPGVAGSTSKLAGVQFNTAAPTLTNAQQAAMQGDSHANLLVNVNTPLPTGANVIGQVGGITATVTVTPTIAAAAYSVGQCVGGLMTLAGASRSGGPGSALLQSAVVSDVSGQDSAIDIVVFRANPTNSTFTDHAACTVNNADLTKIVGTVAVSDCHLLGTSAPGMCQGQQLAMPVDLGNGNTTAWAVMIARGTPTYAGTSNVAVRLGFLQD